MFASGLAPLPHVTHVTRAVDHGARSECAQRLRNDEVLLTRQAREIASLHATVTGLRSALAASRADAGGRGAGDGLAHLSGHGPYRSR